MKNTIITIYTAIFSLLFMTVLFTIAELNIIAKTEFTNQLQQSVVMNASYLIACKLIIQIVLTYLVGNRLYYKIRSIQDKKQGIRDAIEALNRRVYTAPITPDEAFKSNRPIQADVYKEVNTLQFDPIDQVDEMDKNNISIKSIGTKMHEEQEELNKAIYSNIGLRLAYLLRNIDPKVHTFNKKQIEENKRWKMVIDIDDINPKDYEVIKIGSKNVYYMLAE